MVEAAPRVVTHAAELRRDFDRSFAEMPSPGKSSVEDLLAIRLGLQDYALRLSEIAGLFAGKKITRVPGGHSAQLGIVGFRGSIVPVYDLRQLLGRSASEVPHWLVIAAAAPVALAFESFQHQLRVSPDSIAPPHSPAEAHSFTQGFVQSEKSLRPVIHLPSVLDAIRT